MLPYNTNMFHFQVKTTQHATHNRIFFIRHLIAVFLQIKRNTKHIQPQTIISSHIVTSFGYLLAIIRPKSVVRQLQEIIQIHRHQ